MVKHKEVRMKTYYTDYRGDFNVSGNATGRWCLAADAESIERENAALRDELALAHEQVKRLHANDWDKLCDIATNHAREAEAERARSWGLAERLEHEINHHDNVVNDFEITSFACQKVINDSAEYNAHLNKQLTAKDAEIDQLRSLLNPDEVMIDLANDTDGRTDERRGGMQTPPARLEWLQKRVIELIDELTDEDEFGNSRLDIAMSMASDGHNIKNPEPYLFSEEHESVLELCKLA